MIRSTFVRPVPANRPFARAGCALASLLAATLLAAPARAQGAPVQYDLVIANGRVVDPASRRDQVINVGITDGRIAAISRAALAGKRTIDATGLVVAPGFIDLHEHVVDPATQGHQVRDGVTSAFEMEAGTATVAQWYAERGDAMLINFGVSIGHMPVRMTAFGSAGALTPSGPAAHDTATAAQRAQILKLLEQGIAEGAVGVGAGFAYTEGMTRGEMADVFGVASRAHVPVYVHTRTGFAGVSEALEAARLAHSAIHVVHLNSVSLGETPKTLAAITEARRLGRDVTTESYPYSAGMTGIQSAVLDRFENAPDSMYQQLLRPETGERLTRATFAKYRKEGGTIIIFMNTEPMVDLAMTSPLTMVASDALMIDEKGHPRTSGTFSRSLARYVRELKAVPLMEMIRKMSLMPAERLAARVPAMRKKGRIALGADADLTLIDTARVADRATYVQPTLPPDGIPYVIVNGVVVVDNGQIAPGVKPGRPIRARVTTP
ncbi:MAG: amidohydrolase family protein [Gemmatimonadetes bacterium]|nr:amidohydrolase family protein [Gemmatimonadota bacterium]